VTKPTGHRGEKHIHARLALLGRRRRREALATAALAATAAACLLIVAITLAAGYGADQPPRGLRWGLLILAVATMALALGAVARRLLWRPTAAQNARFAEQALGGLDNGLINAVQLTRDRRASPAMVAAATSETAAKLGRADLAEAISLRRLKLAGWAAGVSVALAAVLCLLQWPRVARAMAAAFAPGAYVPTVGSIEIVSIRPGDATIYRGESATIEVTIRNDSRAHHAADVLLDAATDTPRRAPMLIGADRATYTLPLGELTSETRYAVRIGDTRLPADRPWYTIRVVDSPGLEGIDAAFTYPAYTRRESQTHRDIAGPLEAPVGTTVTLTARLNRPAARAWLREKGAPPREMTAADDGRTFTADLDVTTDGGYAVWLSDRAGRVVQRVPEEADDGEAMFAITAVVDQPPTIAFVAPTGEVAAEPGGTVTLTLRADDDYGLTRLGVFLGADRDGATPLRTVEPEGHPAHTTLQHQMAIPADAPLGSVLTCLADTTDNRRLGDITGQTAESVNVCRIRVQKAAAIERRRLDRREQLMRLLRGLLDLQIQAKLAARLARVKAAEVDTFAVRAAEAAADQQAVHDTTGRLLGRFGFDAATQTIRLVLTQLKTNEMALACRQAAMLLDAPDPPARQAAAVSLEATQDRIIDALQTLMACLPSMGDTAAAKQAANGDDLAAYGERLADLAASLKPFADEQARVIAAAERLAKQPVDQFTEEDLALLEDLRTTEDDWNRFLNEAFTDFSKLFRQDFANPSLLAELLSIRTDVTMARGALAAEAQEIAVATASMSAAAENAEELVTNIEKWLPDVPDREQWNMEDPGGHDNLEMPELPGELEDMVGDLLEQQEDLCDEMQDVTSQAAGSFDEGVGWAAMDGPISSFNAQGVTGNMPPDSSEISGRSGEGRQGKSSGEFVQDTFVGKGGRDTPTRLTGEPFMTGQIKDQSTTPPGGATGGGKIGGAAGEGLEGPVPPAVAQQMQRLAGRQAHLANRAERIAAGMRVRDYSNFRLQQAVVLMNRVGGDLQHRRYENALRRGGAVLEALRDSRRGLTDPIRVLRDATDPVPKHVRRDIEQARRSRLPDEYRTILQSYLHKLAGER